MKYGIIQSLVFVENHRPNLIIRLSKQVNTIMRTLAKMKSFNQEKKLAFPLAFTSFLCVFLLVTSFDMKLLTSIHSLLSIFPSHDIKNQTIIHYPMPPPPAPPARPRPPPPPPPRFAYLISGSRGDLEKLWRTLQAVYHPRNYYVLHLDLESLPEERLELASRLETNPVIGVVGNVYMIAKANMVTYRGPTMVSNTLHACAILLKRHKHWDWFINLSASDYPLVTQDDLLYTFSSMNRSLNFIEHTSRLGWKEEQRGMPLIVDPGLYQKNKSKIFWVTPRRTLPTSFKLFTGSAWMILSRPFVEYCVWGWDNLPRTLLMYYSNFVSAPEGYFQTVACNSPEFAQTIVNHDMHYISWDNPPKQHPRSLNISDTAKMISSGAPFARKFKLDDPVLDEIDTNLLGRTNGSFTPGRWCSGDPQCSKVKKNITRFKRGTGAKRLQRLVNKFVLSPKFSQNQCS